MQADKILEDPAVKAAFKALADDENLDILAYIEKVDASISDSISDTAQDDHQTQDQNSDDKAEPSSTTDTSEDSLDTKIKKLGLTEKLPEAFKEAYLSAKQKQLDAECEEIMKDKEVLEVIKGLETDPVSPEFTFAALGGLYSALGLIELAPIELAQLPTHTRFCCRMTS